MAPITDAHPPPDRGADSPHPGFGATPERLHAGSGPPWPRLTAEIVILSAGHYLLAGAREGTVELQGPGSRALIGALKMLDGSRPLGAVLALLPPGDRQAFTSLADRLVELEMIRHGPPPVEAPKTLGVVGEGRLAESLTQVLSGRLPVLRFTECLPAVALRKAVSTRRRRRQEGSIAHWTGLRDSAADLLVIATTRRAADPALAWLATRARINHLVVSAHADDAMVGHVVAPGRTACLFCRSPGSGPVAVHRWRAGAPATPIDPLVSWTISQAHRTVTAFLADGTVWPGLHASGGVTAPSPPDPDCPACSGRRPERGWASAAAREWQRTPEAGSARTG